MEVGRDTGAAPTVIRELMTGECLEHLIDENGPLPADRAIGIIRQILIALQAIHDAGLVNLDLSPADVFMAHSREGQIAKLVDLGEHHLKHDLVLHEDEEIESRNFWAPEQYNSREQSGPLSDIYGAGAILFYMVTGHVPDRRTPIRDAVAQLDKGLGGLIHKAMRAAPENRFQSAYEFILALDNLETVPQPAPQPPPSGTRRPPLFSGESRWGDSTTIHHRRHAGDGKHFDFPL